MDVALATCAELPEPDPDARPLADALADAGLEAEFLAWDDPAADWSRARLTLLRSTWNYPLHPREFMAWAENVAAVSRLWNPLPVVSWNVHKSYLFDLDRAGIPIVPTELVPQGSTRRLSEICAVRGWEDVVVKPAVSAASFRTIRVRPGETSVGEAHLSALVTERDVLVQRYLPSVEHHGEHALIWIDGELTHAVRKTARFDGEEEAVSRTVPILATEAELARRAVSSVDADLLYARIDIAPDSTGAPVVMELELIEPSLYFSKGPQALPRLVAAITRRL